MAAQRSRRRRRRRSTQIPRNKTKQWSLAHLTKTVLWPVALTVLGLLGLPFFFPDVSVSASQIPDMAKALNAKFEITNNGNLAIMNVSIQCQVNEVDLGPLLIRNSQFQLGPRVVAQELLPGETHLVNCPLFDSLGNRNTFTASNTNVPSKADVTISIEFRPKFWPLTRRTQRRLRATRSSSGDMPWQPIAVDDKPFLNLEPRK